MQQSPCPSNQVCLSAVQCSAQRTPEEADAMVCSLQDGVSGICCEEISSIHDTNHPALTLAALSKKDIPSIKQVDDVTLRTALDIGETIFQNNSQRSTLLNTIKNAQSASGQHALFMQASPGVTKLGKKCMVAMEAARWLALESKGKLFIQWIKYLVQC